MTRRFRLVVSGACALLAAVLCGAYGQYVRDEADRVRSEALERYGGEVVSLVVAPEGLEAGDVVDRRNVTERDWLSDLAPQDAVVSLDDVLGAEVTVPAAAGAPLTALNFRTGDEAVEVPSGCVAVTVPVTQNLGLPSSTASGTRLAAYEVEDSGVSLVAADLVVLRAPAEQTTVGSRGEVTLATRPESVASVLSASAEGSLRLALPADDAGDLSAGTGSAPTRVDPVSGGGGSDGGGQTDAGDEKNAGSDAASDAGAASGGGDGAQPGDGEGADEA